MHHLISDGWSMRIFIKEWLTLYVARTQHIAIQLPKLPVQFGDYAHWQTKLLKVEDDCAEVEAGSTQDQLAYWKENLSGAEEVLQLPTDRPREKMPKNNGGSLDIQFDAAVADSINESSRQLGVTPFMLMLAAYQILLSRYSNQKDILVGVPIAGREYKEVQDLIGFFVNTLVVRSDVVSHKTFSTFLSEVKLSTLNAFSNQDVPFDQVIDAVGIERTLSFPPLVQVAFQLHHMRDFENDMSDDTVKALSNFNLKLLPQERSVAKFDLILDVFLGDGEVRVKADYNADLFDNTTILRLLGHYVRVVEQCLTNADVKLADIELLSDEERDQILIGFNDTETDYPELPLHCLFDGMAEKSPQSTALVHREIEVNYGELQKKANQVANYLLGQNVKPGDSVGICLDRSIEMVTAILGILKVGAAYVPLDPNYPDERLGFMINDTKLDVLITEQTKKEKLLNILNVNDHSLEMFVFGVMDSTLEAQPDSLEPIDIGMGDRCCVMFTSGSTGKPKGVQVTHRGVVRLVQKNGYLQVTEKDIVTHVANIAFDASTMELWSALTNGAQLVLVDQDCLLDPEKLDQLVKSKKVSVFFLPTALMHEYAQGRISVFDNVRAILFGGEACDFGLVTKILKSARPDYLINVYGPTENAVITTCFNAAELKPHQTSIPIGKPISNTSVYILDENKLAVPIGVVGELYSGGDGGRSRVFK